ncbi:hypothetical protein F383_09873 [Gossypium arboreum]|uniref:Uncharacterized protein n=1 Tax=Gossypium arboreum TaxID=29729 RepID=A0A0B0N9X0_GOSAR|nr:hypothetical protein F383_09873 [Gossypium arboreum]
MATTPSITDLFAQLALHLQLPINARENEEETLNLSISKLNQSLNLNENPNSELRVLDTALSLMCFKSPQVFDSLIEYLVKTIISVLSSSVTFKVSRLQNEEFLLIDSSNLGLHCVELVEMFNNIHAKIQGKGLFSHLLLRAVLRVAVLASCYLSSSPHKPILVESIEGRSAAVSKLHCHLPAELSLENEELPLRLFFWYLDPLTLKQAVSKILQDTRERPFLCLSEEFHQRMDWRAIIICLALSPVMFIETRALLHNWFLRTGLAFVLDLLAGLVAAILDVISRPTWWGLSVEMGSKLPFSNAYFPNKNHLLRILVGAFSVENFIHLVHATSELVSLGGEQLCPAIKSTAVAVQSIDHKSLWALAIDFPDWFYFASVLLFSEKTLQKNFQAKCSFSPKVGEVHDKESLSTFAARYIAWILSPTSKNNQDFLVDFLTKISLSWGLKQFDLAMPNKEGATSKKKLKKPKVHNKMEGYAQAKEYDCQMIGIWLNETEKMYLEYGSNTTINGSASADSNAFYVLNLQQNVLLRRILLGVLIGCPSCITENGCELLLHYAATGKILQPRETMHAGLRHIKHKSEREDLTTWIDKCSEKDVLAGACLVFGLTDAVDSISASFFKTEESGIDFIYQVKVKARKYLMKCINRLCQLNNEKGGVSTLRDVHNRLERWRHQGREILQVQKDVDDIINYLNQKIVKSNK